MADLQSALLGPVEAQRETLPSMPAMLVQTHNMPEGWRTPPEAPGEAGSKSAADLRTTTRLDSLLYKIK